MFYVEEDSIEEEEQQRKIKLEENVYLSTQLYVYTKLIRDSFK